MGHWTRPTDDGRLEVVGPARCPDGHPLRPGTVLIASTVEEISYTCRTCGLVIHREHDSAREWITRDHPG